MQKPEERQRPKPLALKRSNGMRLQHAEAEIRREENNATQNRSRQQADRRIQQFQPAGSSDNVVAKKWSLQRVDSTQSRADGSPEAGRLQRGVVAGRPQLVLGTRRYSSHAIIEHVQNAFDNFDAAQSPSESRRAERCEQQPQQVEQPCVKRRERVVKWASGSRRTDA